MMTERKYLGGVKHIGFEAEDLTDPKTLQLFMILTNPAMSAAHGTVLYDGKQVDAVEGATRLLNSEPKANETPCIACERDFFSRDGFLNHFTKDHRDIALLMSRWIRLGRKSKMIEGDRTNRDLIKQLRLWGWEEVSRKADRVSFIKQKEGEPRLYIRVNSEDHPDKNLGGVFIAIYQQMGKSPEEFWAGPPKPKLPKPPEPPRTLKHRGTASRILDELTQNGPQSSQMLAEKLGVPLTVIQGSAYHLVSRTGLVKRLKNGFYAAVHQHDHSVRVDYTQESSEKPLEAPVIPAEPEKVVPELPERTEPPTVLRGEPSDQEIFDVLDLLVPQGFKAKHFPYVQAWVAATRDLVRELRNG